MSDFFESKQAFIEFLAYFVITSGITVSIIFHFIIDFIGSQYKNKYTYLLFLVLYYLISGIFVQFQITPFFTNILYFISLFSFLFFLVHQPLAQKISTSLTVCIIVSTVLSVEFGFISSLIYLTSPLNINTIGFQIVSALLLILPNIFLFLIFHIISHKFKVENLQHTRTYLFVLYIPFLLLIIMSQIISTTGYGSGNTIIANNDHFVSVYNHYQILLLYLFSLLCLFILLYAYRKLISYLEEEKQNLLLEQQLETQKIYTNETKLRYELTRSFRHDLTNHIIVLKGLIENHETNKAAQYLSHFEKAADKLTYSTKTGNIAVDVLLNNKLALAQQIGIHIICDVNLPKNINVDDFDLCILFSNALDNAIKACNQINSDNKWIDMRAKRNHDFLIIDIINSCSEFEAFKNGKGIGLANISAVSEKYNGTIHIDKTPKTFVLTILLSIHT